MSKDEILALGAELRTDSLGRGYSGMDDAAVAVSLNTPNRQINRASMTASEVLNAIDITEFNALSAADQQRIWETLHIGDLNPFGVEATIFTSAFGGGSTTITTLAGLRRETVSRARELGLPVVKPGHVEVARL